MIEVDFGVKLLLKINHYWWNKKKIGKERRKQEYLSQSMEGFIKFHWILTSVSDLSSPSSFRWDRSREARESWEGWCWQGSQTLRSWWLLPSHVLGVCTQFSSLALSAVLLHNWNLFIFSILGKPLKRKDSTVPHHSHLTLISSKIFVCLFDISQLGSISSLCSQQLEWQ